MGTSKVAVAKNFKPPYNSIVHSADKFTSPHTEAGNLNSKSINCFHKQPLHNALSCLYDLHLCKRSAILSLK